MSQYDVINMVKGYLLLIRLIYKLKHQSDELVDHYQDSTLEGKSSSMQNYLVFRTNKSKYMLIYLSPIIVMLIVMILQHLTVNNFTWEYPSPDPYSLKPIPKCYGDDCLTLGVVYAGKKEPYMDTVLSHIKQANNFNDLDVRELPLNTSTVVQYI